jgi:hypothetical protein
MHKCKGLFKFYSNLRIYITFQLLTMLKWEKFLLVTIFVKLVTYVVPTTILQDHSALATKSQFGSFFHYINEINYVY